jgi:hypothetical protein
LYGITLKISVLLLAKGSGSEITHRSYKSHQPAAPEVVAMDTITNCLTYYHHHSNHGHHQSEGVTNRTGYDGINQKVDTIKIIYKEDQTPQEYQLRPIKIKLFTTDTGKQNAKGFTENHQWTLPIPSMPIKNFRLYAQGIKIIILVSK